MMSGKDALLCALLDCGEADLSMLEDMECNWNDVLDDLNANGGVASRDGFNALVHSAVNVGRDHIQEAINYRICELEAMEEERGLEDFEAEEKVRLEELRPYGDILSWHNFLDTGVYFQRNEDIYKDYLDEALDEFERYTGLSL